MGAARITLPAGYGLHEETPLSSTPPPDDGTRFETYSDQSPESGSTPFWLDACVRMLKPGPRDRKNPAGADKVLTVAKTLDADRVKVAGEDATEMGRSDIAAVAGYDPDRPDSASWIVTFLQQIGYLRVQKRYEPGTGKRGADRFVVSPRPPLNYVGPRTQHGLLRALRMRTEWEWIDLFSLENPRAKPIPSGDGVGGEPIPSGDGVDPENPRAKPIPSGDGTPRARSSSGPSGPSGGEEGPEGGETTKPAADAAAGTSYEHDELDWARLLARDLPFSTKRGRPITPAEARQLAARFRVATEVHGYSHEQIQRWALDSLAASNGTGAVKYVLGAFANARLDAEPVTESLSLPDHDSSKTSTDTATSSPEPHTSESAAEQQSEPAVDPEQTAEARSAVRANLREMRHRRNLEQLHRKHTASGPDQESA